MNEEEIAQRLRQNIETETPTQPPTISPISEEPVERTDPTPIYELDEITKYKLQDYFETRLKPTDEISNQQLKYIYDAVSKMVEVKEYGYIVARMRELERMIGTVGSENRIYKLYSWLKLDNIRKNIELQQRALVQ